MKGVFSSTMFLSLLSFFITILILLKLIIIRITENSKTKLNLPPSPPKLPILGNLHQLGALPHRSLRELSLKYGDMMMLQLGQRKNPTLVVSSAEVAMEIMKKHDIVFSNRPQNTAAKILLYGCTDVGFGLYGEDWRRKRKICSIQLLNTKMVQSFGVIREEEVAELVNELREVSTSEAKYVNLSEMLLSTLNNIVCKCVLGRKYPGDGHSRVKGLARNVMVHLAAFSVGDYFPLLGWVDVLTGKIRKYQTAFEELDALFDEAIAQHLTGNPLKGFLEILLQHQVDHTKTKSKTNLKLPPSPPKLPLIGNLHQLGTLPHRSLRDLSLKYGEMMMLQLGQRQNPTLVVSSVEVAMEIIKTHDIVFSNRPQNTAAKTLLYECADVAFALYGESWRQKRKICVLELLSPKRVQSFHLIREEEVGKLVDKLREASSYGDGCYVNLSEMLMSTSSNIVSKCLLGQRCSRDGYSRMKELTRKVMVHLTAFTVRDYFPWLGWVDVLTGRVKEFRATFDAIDALFDEAIAQHLTGNAKKGFVDILLQFQQNNMLSFELTKNDLKALLMDMFVGGTDTVSVTLQWTISELLRNPNIMKKAQEEVRKVVGQKSNMEENDFSQMHYLKCIIKETLRLHLPATLLAPRETISSVKLKGYDIPAKTMVYINAWAIQRDPTFWENPEEFLPERFEDSEVDFKGQDFHFIPFGFGRRSCPGMNFGLANIEYVLASLLYWFDWKLPQSDTLNQDIDMSEVAGLVVSKKVPLLVKPIAFSF
ncbi:hypothetical protein RJT34_33240 [Clitoria ternatea]|uniref:Cytochrome P450 n=1 Tax=Clitoria ternatea TaxID=43366 RepID=A0AAN9F007_CLITE